MDTTNTNITSLTDITQSLASSNELLLQMLEWNYGNSPEAIEVFAPDGTSIYVNQAGLELTGITDPSLLIGKYNLLLDPVCNEICGHDVLEKVFRGEVVTFPDFPAPIQDVKDRGVIDEKPWEAATMDLILQPFWAGDKFLYTACKFSVKNIYYGRAEVAGAKKYIDEHWLDELDEDAVAAAVYVSRAHLRALFKQSAGMTLLDYYKKVKVDHIKEKLADKNTNVTDAFSFCGLDSTKAYGKIFKDLTGMTPMEYKNSL